MAWLILINLIDWKIIYLVVFKWFIELITFNIEHE